MFATKTQSPDSSSVKSRKNKDNNSFESGEEIYTKKKKQNNKNKSNDIGQPPTTTPEEEYELTLDKLVDLLLGKVSSADAIEAYEIIDNLAKENRSRLKEEHPLLIGNMLGSLPASYLTKSDIGFFEGVSSLRSDKEKPSGVERMFELLKQPPTWEDLELLELVISILGQPDKEEATSESSSGNSESYEQKNQLIGEKTAEFINNLPDETKKIGNTDEYPESVKRLEILSKYGFQAQINETSSPVISSEDNTEINTKEKWRIGRMILRFVFTKKIVGSKKRLQVIPHLAGIRKKGTSFENIRLNEIQKDIGGHIGGMKFSEVDIKKEQEENKLEDLLKENGKNINELPFEQTNVDTGALNYHADLKNGKAYILANTLPFERLDYITEDTSVRGKDGAFRKLFMEATWNPPSKKEKEGMATLNLKLLLGEIEMTQLRYLDKSETYGIGKLLVNNGVINIQTDLPSATFKNGGQLFMGLSGFLMEASSIIIGISSFITARIQEKDFGNAGHEFAKTLSEGVYNNLSVNFSFGSLTISNFIGTELGYIDLIQMSETSLRLKQDKNAKIEEEIRKTKDEIDEWEKMDWKISPSLKEKELSMLQEKLWSLQMALDESDKKQKEKARLKAEIEEGNSKLKKLKKRRTKDLIHDKEDPKTTESIEKIENGLEYKNSEGVKPYSEELEKNNKKLDRINQKLEEDESEKKRKRLLKKKRKQENKSKGLNKMKEEYYDLYKDDSYEFSLESESLELKNADLVEEIIQDSIMDIAQGMDELEFGNLLEFDNFLISGIEFSTSLTPEKTENTRVNISSVKVPRIIASGFKYLIFAKNEKTSPGSEEDQKSKVLYEIAGSFPAFYDTEISNFSYTLGDYTESGKKGVFDVKMESFFIPLISFEHLAVYDKENKKDLLQLKSPFLTNFKISGLNISEETSFTSVGFDFKSEKPVKGNANYGETSGNFGLSQLSFFYQPGKETENNTSVNKVETPEDKEMMKVELKLDYFDAARLKFGKEGDNFRIFPIKGKGEGKGATMKGIDASVSYFMKDEKAVINRFNIDEISASNLKVIQNDTPYTLIGDATIQGFYVNGVTVDLSEGVKISIPDSEATEKDKTKESLSTNIAGWSALNIHSLWWGISTLGGLSTGKVGVSRITDQQGEKGFQLDINDLAYDNMLYQETKSKTGPDANKLATAIKPEMAGNADITASIMDNGDKNVAFKLPNGSLSLSKVYYHSKNGNYLTHNQQETPLIIQEPTFNVTIDKHNNILINKLNIKRIEAAGLRGKFGDIKFKCPENSISSINDIEMSKLNLAGGALKGNISTGKTDLRKTHIDLSNIVGNRLIAFPYMEWDDISFKGDISGEYTLDITSPSFGVGEAREENDEHALTFNSYPDIRMRLSNTLDKAELFNASSITIKQEIENKEKIQKIILRDAEFNSTEIDGDFFIGESDIDFEKVILKGKVIGDLEIENNKDELWVCGTSENGKNSITLEGGKIILYENELRKLSSNDDSNKINKNKEKSDKPLDELYPNYTGMLDFLDSAEGIMTISLFLLGENFKFDIPIFQGYVDLETLLKQIKTAIKDKFPIITNPTWISKSIDESKIGLFNKTDKYLNSDYTAYGVIPNIQAPMPNELLYEIPGSTIEGPKFSLINNPLENENIISGVPLIHSNSNQNYPEGLKPDKKGVDNYSSIIIETDEEHSNNKFPIHNETQLAKLSAIIETQLAEVNRSAEFKRRNNTEEKSGNIFKLLSDIKLDINLSIENMDLTKLPPNISDDYSIMVPNNNTGIENVNVRFTEVQRPGMSKVWSPELELTGFNLPGFIVHNDKFTFDAENLNIGKVTYDLSRELPKREISVKNITLDNMNLNIYKNNKENE